MADDAQDFANKTFAKQGLNPAPAGRPPRAGDEAIAGRGTDILDPTGRTMGTAMRADSDSVGMKGTKLQPSMLHEMINKYAGAVDAANAKKKYGGE